MSTNDDIWQKNPHPFIKSGKPETAEVKELRDMVYRAQLMLSRTEYMTTAKEINDDQYLELWLKNAERILASHT